MAPSAILAAAYAAARFVLRHTLFVVALGFLTFLSTCVVVPLAQNQEIPLQMAKYSLHDEPIRVLWRKRNVFYLNDRSFVLPLSHGAVFEGRGNFTTLPGKAFVTFPDLSVFTEADWLADRPYVEVNLNFPRARGSTSQPHKHDLNQFPPVASDPECFSWPVRSRLSAYGELIASYACIEGYNSPEDFLLLTLEGKNIVFSMKFRNVTRSIFIWASDGYFVAADAEIERSLVALITAIARGRLRQI